MRTLTLFLLTALLLFAACSSAPVTCEAPNCEYQGECIQELESAGEQLCIQGDIVDLPTAPASP